MRIPRAFLRSSLLAVVMASCGPSGECEQSADCPSALEEPGVCLQDLDRGERYCTVECQPASTPYGDPCPLGRQCAPKSLTAQGDVLESICVERVFRCLNREGCGNGLDDDCDGETDESPCQTIVCSADAMCGDLRIAACILRDETRECGPVLQARNHGAKCETAGDCYNGPCVEGFCAPACAADDSACPDDHACVTSPELGLNVCLRRCLGDEICRSGGATDGHCVTRDVCSRPSDPITCFDYRTVCVR